MNAWDVIATIVMAPTFGLPLVLATALVVGTFWWSRRRTSPPSRSPAPSRPDSEERRPLRRAYTSLEAGRYFPTVYQLWERVASAIWHRFGARIRLYRSPLPAEVVRRLPSEVDLARTLRDLVRAYYSSFRVENPSWLERHSRTLAERQRRIAAREFSTAVTEVSAALSLLEPGLP